MASNKGTQYYTQGCNAVAYVKSKLRFGPANNPLKLQPDLVSQLKAMGALLRTRDGEDKSLADGFVNPADSLRVAQAFADNAERYGGGNCGEHAASAYLWLRRNGVFPIDWIKFTNKDHSFVVIGRSDAGKYTPRDIPKQPWFPDAVICDAYFGRCNYWSALLAEYDPTVMASLLHQEAQGLQQWINK